MEKNVIIYTDGACSGNPGKGGWAYVLKYGEHEKEGSGFVEETTNNKMELQAVIEALKALKRECKIELYTDSIYVKNGITNWIEGWKKNNWKTSNKQDVKNKELWQDLDFLNQKYKINWNWVKGHANNEFNNRVDKLARDEISKNK